MNSKSADEDQAWSRLLHEIPIQEAQEAHWRSLLENVLEYPERYSGNILSAAMQRYQRLTKGIGTALLEEDEAELGLP